MSEYKKMLDEKIQKEADLICGGKNPEELSMYENGKLYGIYDGANLLAPMLLEAIEKLEYVSLHLEDGYIVDEVLRKFEEFCK